MVQVVAGLADLQLAGYEAAAEAAMVNALNAVASRMADRIAATRVELASARVPAMAMVAADEPPPPPDIPGPPGQPYVSPDDLAAIGPMWDQQVAATLLPLAAEVYRDSANTLYAQLVDATGLRALPPVSSQAAEAYLATAANTFSQVGDTLWEASRSQLLDGFKEGDSIPELAARVRQAAQISAPSAVMVARTQILDASNAGSIATARASGLALRKGWFSTADARTRPTHITAGATYGAEVNFIPLADTFTVGGFSCDRPHDPILPPAERYRCRCTIGYAVGARSATPLVQSVEPPLPGQSGQVDELAAELQARREGVFADVHGQFEQLELPPVRPPVGPLRAAPSPGGPAGRAGLPRVPVRPVLQKANSRDALGEAMQAEVRRVTGRDIAVEVPADASLTTMREFYEGVLSGMERFPETQLRGIGWFARADGHYAEADGESLLMNSWWSSTARRPALVGHVQRDVAGWDEGLTGWMPRNAGQVDSLGTHEYAHIVHRSLPDPDAFSSQVLTIVRRQAADAGIPDETLVARELGAYATSDEHELIAGAFVDVLTNGELASPLSREIMQAMEVAYRRGAAGAVRAAEAVQPAAQAGRLAPIIDRSLSVEEVLAAEERARVQALTATPVRLRDLPQRGETAKALRHYQRQGDEEANGLLIRGKVGRPQTAGKKYVAPSEAEVRKAIEQIDGALARSELDEGITVFRGMSRSPVPGQVGSTVGRTFTQKGYMSTSASRREAVQFATGEQTAEGAVMLEVRVPPGIRAVGISDDAFKGASPSVVSEQEILLDRGLRFRVVSDEMRGDVYRSGSQTGVTARQYRHIVVEVVPPAPAKAAGRAVRAASRATPSPGQRSVMQLRTAVADKGVTVPAGLRTPALRQLVDELESGVAPAAARARAVETVIAERRSLASALTEAVDAAENGSERALRWLAGNLGRTLGEDALRSARPLIAALESADPAAVRAAVTQVARAGKLKPVGTVGEVRTLDRGRMEWVGDSRADVVQVVRPGFETTFEGKPVLVSKAAVQPATAEQIAARAPAKVAKKAAPRLTERQIVSARPEELAQAARDGRVSPARAAAQIRDLSSKGPRSASQILALDQTSPALRLRAAELAADADRLDALADEVAALGRQTASRAVKAPAAKAAVKKVAPAGKHMTLRQIADPATSQDEILAAVAAGRVPLTVPRDIREIAQKMRQQASIADLQDLQIPGAARAEVNRLARGEADRLDALADRIAAAQRAARKAAPVKKVAAPKAPPAPEKLSIPALKTELQRHIDAVPAAQRLDLAGVPKPTLARWVSRSRELPADAMQAEVGRWRQVVIDKRRAAAEMLAEADELLANGASAATLGARGAGRLRSIEQALEGWSELAEVRKVVTAMASGDAAKVRRALAAAEKKLGLRRVGPQAGTVTRVEPGMVDIAGGPARYRHATVVRPGFEIEVGGQRVVLSRPVVEEATEADVIAQVAKLSAAKVRAELAAGQVGKGWLSLATSKDISRADLDRALARLRLGDDAADVDLALRTAGAEARAAELRRLAAAHPDGMIPRGKGPGWADRVQAPAGKFDPATQQEYLGIPIPAGADVKQFVPGWSANFHGVQVVAIPPRVGVADWSAIDRGVTPSRGPGVPKLTDLRGHMPGNPYGTAEERAAFSQYQEALEYRYRSAVEGPIRLPNGQFTVRVEQVDSESDRVYAGLEVLDSSGRKVGTIERELANDQTGPYAYHAFLSLDSSVQGSGFADVFNDNLFEWYRRSGVARVKVHADIDVGSYTWATQGFDFEDAVEAQRFLQKARKKLDAALQPGAVPTGLTDQQLQDLSDYLDSIASGKVTPRAMDIAQFGRQPGQSGVAGDRWPGNWLLLGGWPSPYNSGVDWHGVKYLI